MILNFSNSQIEVSFTILQQPAGSNNLWDLVSVVQGMDDALLGENYSKGIMHVKHLTKFKAVSIYNKCYINSIYVSNKNV